MKDSTLISLIALAATLLNLFFSHGKKIKAGFLSKEFSLLMQSISIAFIPLGLTLALLANNTLLLRGELMNSYIVFLLMLLATLGFAFFNYRLWQYQDKNN